VGVAARTRPLERDLWLTNEKQLVYVLDLPESGQAVIEDCRNGEVECVPSKHLEGWRVVIPQHG
jgi:hypothetical protein